MVRNVQYSVMHYSTDSTDEVSDCLDLTDEADWGTERTIQCNTLQYRQYSVIYYSTDSTG